jgi:hypothetical protein
MLPQVIAVDKTGMHQRLAGRRVGMPGPLSR